MSANQQKHYESLAKAEADQRANFEDLYKEIFGISEMPLRPLIPGQVVEYKCISQNRAYRFFCSVTTAYRSDDGVTWVWKDISLIQWITGERFANQPKHEYVRSEKDKCAWTVVFHL